MMRFAVFCVLLLFLRTPSRLVRLQPASELPSFVVADPYPVVGAEQILVRKWLDIPAFRLL